MPASAGKEILVPSLESVRVPGLVSAVFRLTVEFRVPGESVLFAFCFAWPADQLDAHSFPTRRSSDLQFASTALTVTLNELPAVRADGVPVLPVALPGSAV